MELLRSLTFIRYRVRMALLATFLAIGFGLSLLSWNVGMAQPVISRVWSEKHTVGEDLPVFPAFMTVALSSRGVIAGADWRGGIHLYKPGEKPSGTLENGELGTPGSLIFSSDGTSLLGAAMEVPQIVCWDVASKSVRWTVQNDQSSGFTAIAESVPSGEFYAADRAGRLWRIGGDGSVLRKFRVTEPSEFVETIDATLPDEGVLVCLRAAGLVLVAPSGEWIRPLRPGVADAAMEYYGARRLPDGRAVFIAEESSGAVSGAGSRVSDTRSLYLCDLRGGLATRLESTQNPFTPLIVIPDTHLILAHSSEGSIRLWSARHHTLLWAANPYPSEWQKVSAIAYDPASRRLCLAGNDTMELWQLTWRAPWGFDLPMAESWK